MKDQLFLLHPGFQDGEGAPYYCPYCTIFEGLLHLYPQLLEHLEVHRVAFPRPRAEIVALLGEEFQSCPVLIIRRPIAIPLKDVRVLQANALSFIDEAEDIGNYLSQTYGIPRPH